MPKLSYPHRAKLSAHVAPMYEGGRNYLWVTLGKTSVLRLSMAHAERLLKLLQGLDLTQER